MNESLYRVDMLYFMISITGFRSFYIVDKRKFIALSNLIQQYICIKQFPIFAAINLPKDLSGLLQIYKRSIG